MSRISQLMEWIVGRHTPDGRRRRVKPPPILFAEYFVVDKPPQNANVRSKEFYVVNPNNRPKWVMFLCPCGCKSVITLTLQASHRPKWLFVESEYGRPTISPSVWRDIGCLSHFWIDDGRVYWVADTGMTPVVHRLQRK